MAEAKFKDGTCRDRIVEWGSNKAQKPSEGGLCACYKQKCDMFEGESRNGLVDLGEHTVRFYPLRMYRTEFFVVEVLVISVRRLFF